VSDPVAIGVDVGGTHLRAAAVAADGSVLDRHRAPSPVDDPESLVSAIAEAAGIVGEGLPIGVGVAGVVDGSGTFRYGPNLAVRDVPIRARLTELLGVEVSVINDATAAVHGERSAGAAHGLDDVVLFTLGTGIGGGIVAAGRLVTGTGGLAGELGHLTVVPDGRMCGCGGRGHVEAHASGSALEAAARDVLEAGVATALAPGADAIEVVGAAGSGDAAARAILADAARAFGVAVAEVATTLDPAVVLLGGGAGAAFAPWYVPAAEAALAERTFASRFRTLPPVRLATLGDDAGVIGAALVAAHDDIRDRAHEGHA
jgi:glucokinase